MAQSIIKEDAVPCFGAADDHMITKLTKSALMAALRMGGFIGWSLAIMCICQQNLRYYRDDTLLLSVNTTFLVAGVLTSAVLVVVLLLIDFDGLLNDRLLKWLPGVMMAETGIALSLSNVDTMNSFAAIAGVAAAFGALAAMSHLIQVKVGQRMIVIGLALAIGGGIRLLTAAIAGHASRTGLVIISVAVGIIAALTVHTRGSSDDRGGLLVGLAEASPRTIISKVPYVYIIMPVLAGAFWLAHSHINGVAQSKLPAGYEGFETMAYAGFIIAALAAALFVKLSRLSLLFVLGTGMAAAAGMLAGLPYITDREAGFFALMSFGGLAAIRACIYLFIIVFSMDRPHPLFYAMFGYAVATLAELAGIWLDGRITDWPLSRYITILIALMPLGGALLSWGMKKYGFSQEMLDHHKIVRTMIRKSCAEHEFSEREQYMIESVVLDGNGVEEIAGHMLFSHNTVKVLLRPVFSKLEISDLDELREYFSKAAESEEKFRAQVHAAEDEKRAADKAKARQERREQREQERRERERMDKEELERKLMEMQTMEQIMGVEHFEAEADIQQPDDSTDTKEETIGSSEENTDEQAESTDNETVSEEIEDEASQEQIGEEQSENADPCEETDEETENVESSEETEDNPEGSEDNSEETDAEDGSENSEEDEVADESIEEAAEETTGGSEKAD